MNLEIGPIIITNIDYKSHEKAYYCDIFELVAIFK